MAPLHPTAIPTRRSTPLWVAPAGAAALWALTALPAILTGLQTSRGAHDAINFHIPTIRMLAEALPRVPVASDDYIVVMTPGYHLVVAAAARLGASELVMQFVGSLFTLALLMTLATICAVMGGPRRALVLTAPVAVSLYVFSAGVWLLPDNAGWLFVLVILALALRRRVDAWTLLGGGAALALLVLMRQSHIWAAALLWTCAWLGPTRRGPDRSDNPLTHIRTRIAPAALSVVATAPAFILLGVFVAAWGGYLAPPVFRNMYRLDDLGTYEAPLFFLAVFGMVSAPLISMVASTVVELWAWRRWALFAAPLAAMGAALLVNTKFNVEQGRFSGIWNISREADRLLGVSELSATTSPTMVLGIGFGALMLLIWMCSLTVRDRWIFGAAITAFVASQCASYFVWQRYHEPFALIALVLMASRLPVVEQRIGLRARKTPLIGPAILAVMLGSLTVEQIVTESPARRTPRERLFRQTQPAAAEPPPADDPA